MRRQRREAWAVAFVIASAAVGCRRTECRLPPPTCAPTVAATPVLPGGLSVTSDPGGEVWIGGRSLGLTPLETTLVAGTHEVIVRLAGFEDARSSVRVAGGQRATVAARLVARDTEDRQVLQALASRARLWVAPFPLPTALRGGDEPSVTLVYPRGPVRVEDMGDARIDFPAKPPEGEVRFLKDAQVLARLPIGGEGAGAWVRQVPQAVRDGVTPGDSVRWGWFPKTGEATEASFEVAERPGLASTLASIESAVAGQPKAAASYLRIQVLSDAGLPYAAHQEAARLIREGTGGVRAWAAVLDSLERMGVPKTTLGWREAQTRIAAFSRSEQAEAFGGGEYARTKLVDHLRAGRPARALQMLDRETLSALSQDPAALRGVVEQHAAHARRMAAISPAAARRLSEVLAEAAAKALEQAPDTPDARWAMAWTSVGRARTTASASPKTKPVLSEAAESLVTLYEQGLDDEGRAYAQAASWVAEGAAGSTDRAERRKALADAAQLVDRAQKGHPDGVHAAVAAATLLRMRAEHEEARHASTRIKEALAVLRPHLERVPPEPVAATAHTDLLTYAERKNLHVGEEYRTVTEIGRDSLARFEIPESERWVAVRDLPEGVVALLEQRDSDGETLRTIVVRAVQWGGVYRFPSGLSMGAENTGLLAKSDLEEARRDLAKVSAPGSVVRGPFSRRFSSTETYDVRGTDHDGAFRRTRAWVFKAAATRVSFLVTITEHRAIRGSDPEVEVFRESFEDLAPHRR